MSKLHLHSMSPEKLFEEKHIVLENYFIKIFMEPSWELFGRVVEAAFFFSGGNFRWETVFEKDGNKNFREFGKNLLAVDETAIYVSRGMFGEKFSLKNVWVCIFFRNYRAKISDFWHKFFDRNVHSTCPAALSELNFFCQELILLILFSMSRECL